MAKFTRKTLNDILDETAHVEHVLNFQGNEVALILNQGALDDLAREINNYLENQDDQTN